jgi:excisionase family DNA binding protein
VSRRYISINEAAEYLGTSTQFVRNLIMEGEIKGYRIGSYARHRTLRVDLDELDKKLMQPIGRYWNDPSAKPRKRTSNSPVPDRSTAVDRIDTPSTRRTTASAHAVTVRSVITSPTALGNARLRPG